MDDVDGHGGYEIDLLPRNLDDREVSEATLARLIVENATLQEQIIGAGRERKPRASSISGKMKQLLVETQNI